MPSHVNGNDSITDRFDLRRMVGWMSRPLDPILADLRLVDCGSLDVLLYCADELTAGIPGCVEAD